VVVVVVVVLMVVVVVLLLSSSFRRLRVLASPALRLAMSKGQGTPTSSRSNRPAQ
jgi:predicted lysophospholipase L1 biosynthesis ABC-type transport system permease subunit